MTRLRTTDTPYLDDQTAAGESWERPRFIFIQSLTSFVLCKQANSHLWFPGCLTKDLQSALFRFDWDGIHNISKKVPPRPETELCTCICAYSLHFWQEIVE